MIRAFGQQERFSLNMQAAIDKLNVSHDRRKTNALTIVERILLVGAVYSQIVIDWKIANLRIL